MATKQGRQTIVTLEERRLVDRVKKREARAFAELVARYQASVWGYLTRCGLPPSAREDVFQEVFLKVYRAMESFQHERSFRPWLFTIVANTVRSHFRKLRVEELVFPERIDDTSSNATEILEALETADWLAQAIAQLPIAQREVLILVGIEQLSQGEVANILDTPLNTIKTQLRRARHTLAKHLASRHSRKAREESP